MTTGDPVPPEAPRRATPPGPGTTSGGVRRPKPGPAVRRLPFLAGAVCALVAGLWGGLTLLGLDVPPPWGAFAAQHGPLMALGFLGTLISLERSVALGRSWGYAAPALSALGALALVLGAAGPGRFLLTAAAGWLIAVYVVLYSRRRDRDLVLQAAGAVAWYVGGLLWIEGRPVAGLVPWLAAFLVLTIAGERLELARIAFLGRRASGGMIAAAAVLGAGVAVAAVRPDPGWRITGLGMLALALWLAVHDVARRTARGHGLPRYAAVCLLAGYGWLAIAGGIWLAAGRPTGDAVYDAALHALFLGFVMSMVFGHAPVILPAVLRVPLPYHPVLYGPLALLHGALLLRIAGDLAGSGGLRTAGGVAGEIALLAFAACAVAAGRLASRTGGGRGALASGLRLPGTSP